MFSSDFHKKKLNEERWLKRSVLILCLSGISMENCITEEPAPSSHE